MKNLKEFREIYKQDAQRVKYLQGRFIRRVISSSEAQELIDLTHKHGQKLKPRTQEQLDKIAARIHKQTSHLSDFKITSSKKAEPKKTASEIAESRARILESIKSFRKKNSIFNDA